MRTKTCCVVLLIAQSLGPTSAQTGERPADILRVGTYNVSFYRDREGQLIEDFRKGDNQVRSIAEVIRRVRPDVLLLNEIDYVDPRSNTSFGTREPIIRFLDFIDPGGNEVRRAPRFYKHWFATTVNTGVPTGLDLDRDGATDGPGDAYGWGRYPGQFGMALYSRFPIQPEYRTFQKFLWKDMPDAKLPVDPDTGEPYYSEEILEVFRLSSKSHWDVAIDVELEGRKHKIHFLCSHPTPPVFDGPEDRNGKRNHDEIRLWADYIDPERSDYLVDDHGRRGGLAEDASFVILGDLNADPIDGNSAPAIEQLLKHPRINADKTPTSEGAVIASRARPDLNGEHQGDASDDTTDFSGDGHGNLRVDYVLPSRELAVVDSGVFWPKPGEPGSEAIKATDHRLVWVDLRLTDAVTPRPQASE